MSKVLLILALLCAVVVTVLGFDLASVDDPHLFGWVGLTLTFYVGSLLAPE